MNRRVSRVFFAGMLLCMLLLAMAAPVSAATQKAKAMKAYRNFLSEKKIALKVILGEDEASAKFKTDKMKFAIIYLNKDSIPELVIDNSANNSGNYYSPFGTAIFTWADGEVQQVYIQDSYYQLRKYYRKKGVLMFVNRAKSSLMVTARIADDEATVVAVKDGSRLYGPDYFAGKAKKISKAQYHKLIKKVIGSRKAVKINYRENTKVNREKYLK